ncbi:MAG: hypothetical protein HQL72_02815 [Magnetococcales bacterium]|nr:hypothetical protein [Magnetococcales bacterium]
MSQDSLARCALHGLPLHPDTTGCVACLRESQAAIPKKQVGRPQVGVDCREGEWCANLAQCRKIYTQDLLNDDGSCPHFHPIEISSQIGTKQ